MSYTAGTYSIKPCEVIKKWHIIDANGLVLGRMAAEVAKILRGKHKASFTPHVDCGDNVIIINAQEIALTGKKLNNKKHYWHTGYPGGIKQRTAKEILQGKFPERLVKKAIERMLPKDSSLARKQFSNLHVYASNEHPHQGQKPVSLDLAMRNRKNKIRM